jgi:hypothetical protein
MMGRMTFIGLLVVLGAASLAYAFDPSVDSSDASAPVVEPSPTATPEAADEESGEEAVEDDARDDDEEAGEPDEPDAEPRNREDCDEIRGRPYLSHAERAWYLDNCVGW